MDSRYSNHSLDTNVIVRWLDFKVAFIQESYYLESLPIPLMSWFSEVTVFKRLEMAMFNRKK